MSRLTPPGARTMCDNDSIHDILEFQRRAELSRRQFGAMTVGDRKSVV